MALETMDGTTYAGWAAFVLTFATAIWKGWFGVKEDSRKDSKGQLIHGTYEEIVNGLREERALDREEMASMRIEISLLRSELDAERKARVNAELQIAKLQRQVAMIPNIGGDEV